MKLGHDYWTNMKKELKDDDFADKFGTEGIAIEMDSNLIVKFPFFKLNLNILQELVTYHKKSNPDLNILEMSVNCWHFSEDCDELTTVVHRVQPWCTKDKAREEILG